MSSPLQIVCCQHFCTGVLTDLSAITASHALPEPLPGSNRWILSHLLLPVLCHRGIISLHKWQHSFCPDNTPHASDATRSQMACTAHSSAIHCFTSLFACSLLALGDHAGQHLTSCLRNAANKRVDNRSPKDTKLSLALQVKSCMMLTPTKSCCSSLRSCSMSALASPSTPRSSAACL